MADRNKIIFVFGKKEEDARLKEFFSQFPSNEQNRIAKRMILTVIERMGMDWNPIMEGYSLDKKSSSHQKPLTEDRSVRTEMQETNKNENETAAPRFSRAATPQIRKTNESEAESIIPIVTGRTNK